jgi:iron complex outermembrane receptor protein
MKSRLHVRLGRALRRRPSLSSATAALLLAASTASAQARPDRTKADSAKADSAKADSARADSAARKIEGVLVRAIRAGDAAPIAQKTIDKAAIEQRHFGQDVPMLLMNAAPSLVAHTETGTQWGYSYLRLRGLDQTRLNITIDGVTVGSTESGTRGSGMDSVPADLISRIEVVKAVDEKA